MQDSIERAYQDFANAIVKKAVDDYRRALDGIGYDGKSPAYIIRDVEKFFRSHYFEILTDVNGEFLIEKLRQEHERSNHGSNISTGDI
jgi:hypothetical protein